MRMLDGIEAPRGRSPSRSASGPKRWPLLLAGALVVLVLAAWWAQRQDTEPALLADAPAPVRKPSAVTRAEPPVTTVTAAASVPATTDPAPARPSDAARIEASAEPVRPTKTIAQATPAAVSPAAPRPAARSAAATAPTKTATKRSAAPPVHVATKAEARRAAAAHDASRRSARANAPAATTARAAPRGNDDADVALVRAMLARLSSGAAGTTEAPFINATIGQLAARCQASAPDDPIAAFECRRQVCADYWGRVEACPIGLAPKNR